MRCKWFFLRYSKEGLPTVGCKLYEIVVHAPLSLYPPRGPELKRSFVKEFCIECNKFEGVEGKWVGTCQKCKIDWRMPWVEPDVICPTCKTELIVRREPEKKERI